MTAKRKPPLWFWIAGVALLLWGVSGVAAFYMSFHLTPQALAALSDYDRKLHTDRATWFILVYGVAVWAGLLGALLLLFRRRLAPPLLVASLVAVIVMFGWMFLATDIIAVKGVVTAMGFPIVIVVIGTFAIWLGQRAAERGWIV
ncbi:MAG: hypothetical protein JWN21_522 [Sphingomonas bacterium]|uniref:hypothetical protein n=1 Tax=Sphingomonas bacterium TaxID=1895847 RepID=UPI00262163CB|nr:hypothetical protein [Sphingomonas bacterium]MDB5694979.1 hypothetical protein [Sphingomonas bacterium]